MVNRPEPVKRDLQGRLTEPNAGEAGRSAFVRNARLAMIVLGIVMAVVLIASWMDQPVEYTAAEETAAYDPAYDGTADAADAAADAAMADASAAPEAAVDAPATDAATTDYYASDAPAE